MGYSYTYVPKGGCMALGPLGMTSDHSTLCMASSVHSEVAVNSLFGRARVVGLQDIRPPMVDGRELGVLHRNRLRSCMFTP